MSNQTADIRSQHRPCPLQYRQPPLSPPNPDRPISVGPTVHILSVWSRLSLSGEHTSPSRNHHREVSLSSDLSARPCASLFATSSLCQLWKVVSERNQTLLSSRHNHKLYYLSITTKEIVSERERYCEPPAFIHPSPSPSPLPIASLSLSLSLSLSPPIRGKERKGQLFISLTSSRFPFYFSM